jgi:hypothetical protein
MDAGSLLLLRPNIGMEHRKGQYSFSWLAMYKTNQSYWLNEYTGLANAKGLRTDFSIRRYSKTIPAFYTEAQVRLQYVKSDSLEQGFQEYFGIANIKKGGELGLKIGMNFLKEKRFNLDLSFGLGGTYYKMVDKVCAVNYPPIGGNSL